MRSFILLILSLTAGCEVSSEVKGCEGGWVELTCKYPREDQEYQKIEVIKPRRKNIRSTKKDVWEKDGRFSLYHDTRNKNLRMAIKQLKSEDFGKYKCKFEQDDYSFYGPGEQELEPKVVKDGCQTPFNQTAYRTAKTTITCDFPNEYNSSVKFICKDNNEICEEILSQSSVKSNGTFTLTDTNSGFNMSISNVSSQHAGVYWCGVKSNEGSYRASLRKIQLEIKMKDGCQTPFNQTVYRTAKTTITCDYPNEYNSSVKFICKDNNEICEEILSTQSSVKSNGTFTLTDTNSGFNMSISNVSSQHAGVYWCGVKSNEGSYRVSLRKIQLEIKNIKSFKRSPTSGQNFTYWCVYPQGAPIKKFICKGEDPSICQPLWSTSKPRTNTGKFSMEDDRERRNVTITVRDLTTDDAGTYWCGAENTDNRHSKTFFNRLEMTVVPRTRSPAERNAIIITVICVAVLLLVLILVLIYTRCSKYKTNEEELNNAEDFIYEEIEEQPHKPDSGTALKTIYVSAKHPTNPSAFTHYSNINHPNSPGEVSGDTSSTVKDNGQYSTVNHPSRCSENPLYSTVNKPQEH